MEAPIDPGLEALIMSCLEKSPDRRPQTARELGERLAGLELSHVWTEERARLWWRRYAPTDAGPESASPSSLYEGSTTGSGEPVPSVIERSHS